MRILLVGDFAGSFPEGLLRNIDKETFDVVLSTGDFVDVKRIGDLFRMYGPDYKKKIREDELFKIGMEGVEKAKTPLSILNKFGENAPVYIVGGNNEDVMWKEFEEKVAEYPNLKLLKNDPVQIKKFTLVGWWGKEAASNVDDNLEENKKELSKTLEQIKEAKNSILLTHFPPYNCKFDIVNDKGNFNHGKHVGSKLVKFAIDKHKVPMVICGHMEEYQGECFANARIINPGSAEKEKYAILELNSSIEKAKLSFH